MADQTYEGQARIYRKQGATGFVVASGGEITVEAGGEINASAGMLTLPPNLKRGFLSLDILSARSLASGENYITANVTVTGTNLGASIGGILHAGSVPTLTVNSTDARGAVLTWASGQTPVIAFPPVPIPPDFSSAGGLTYHALAERTSDNASNNVLDFRVWAGQTATNVGTTGTTMTTTPAEYSITVASGSVGAHPGVWNFHLVPGTHTNNAVRVFAAWVEYDKRTS